VRLIHFGNLNGGHIKGAEVFTRSKLWKPEGRNLLWTSPVNSEYGWEDWCLEESPNWISGKQRWMLNLDSAARVYVIDGHDDLCRLVDECGVIESSSQLLDTVFVDKYPDWPNIARHYDAVWLTLKGETETRFTLPLTLYGWDCETVCVFRADKVEVVKELPRLVLEEIR